jgi:hypothetical protein
MSLPGALAEVATVERLNVWPGDRLVLTFPRPVSDEEYEDLCKSVKETWGLPKGVKVIILDSGARLQILACEGS